MSFGFEKVSVPEGCPADLELYFSDEIHSTNEDYRKNIRTFLWKQLAEKGISESEKENILNLEKVPREIGSYFATISHSKKAAAVALSKKPVGVDTEDLQRISTGLINRIATGSERQSTPQPNLLFSAKEACWKACSSTWKISTISQIETYDWKETPLGWSTFLAKFKGSPLPGTGSISVISNICLSFFVCP